MDSHQSREPLPKLALAALGVVFGDIGTSPLYALRACLMAAGETVPGPEAILGVLSLIFWTIALAVTVKYVLIVLRNDNRGEGGVLALMALLASHRSSLSLGVIMAMGVAGTALFFGDGALTPAVTVLSAVEGLKLASPAFSSWVIPITVLILLGMFAVQKHGTGKIGVVFGPVMLLWFITLGAMGLSNIGANPTVLKAVNPVYAVEFLVAHSGVSLAVIAGAFLTVTGGEALYADLGHFGRRPIQVAWVGMVWPGLLLCYFGQGALLLEDPSALRNPFYLMVPAGLLLPLVLLASCASVIASQSVISGVFSIAQQAQQMGFLPRMTTTQTSEDAIGQVYLPVVNAVLCAAAIGIVLVFRSSEALANAYGIAVASTMVIETLLLVVLLRARQTEADTLPEGIAPGAKAPARWMLPVLVPLALIDVLFFVANAEKIPAGGWFPLAFGGLVYMVMSTWKNGREIVTQQLLRQESPVTAFLAEVERNPPVRVGGTAVFLTSQTEGIPRTLLRNLRFNGVLHETTIVVSVSTGRVPRVSRGKRVTVIAIAPGLWRVNTNVGFREKPSIPQLLREAERLGLTVETDRAIYYLGREQIRAENPRGMSMWRKRIFLFMARNAEFAGASYKLPQDRIVEMGGYITI